MAKHITKYKVFLESNAMIGRHWMKSDLLEQVATLRAEQLADIRFYIPGIVHEEWSRHYMDEATTHLNKAASALRGLDRMNIKAITIDSMDEATMQKRADAILKKAKIFVAETPYESIDMAAIIARAVKHIPPFEPDSDKGIKDAFVAHTMKEYIASHSLQKNTKYAIITQDEILVEYLEELLGEELEIYGSLEDFASSIRLTIDKLSNDLLAKAKAKFYTPRDENSIYLSEKVFDKLFAAYEEYISSSGGIEQHLRSLKDLKIKGGYSQLPNDSSWVRLDRKYFIDGTSFVKRSRGRLHWSTLLTLKQAYATSSQSADGIVINNPSSVIHEVQYQITWSAALRDGNELSAPKLLDISTSDEGVVIDLFPNIDYETGVTNLTRSAPPTMSTSLMRALDALRGSQAQGIAELTSSANIDLRAIKDLQPPTGQIAKALATSLKPLSDAMSPLTDIQDRMTNALLTPKSPTAQPPSAKKPKRP